MYHGATLQLVQVPDVTYQISIAFESFHFLTPCLAQLAKILLLLKPCKPSSAEIGSYACC